MKRIALTLAAALGLAAVAGPARADHDDGWRDHERREHAAPAPAYPAPAYAPAPAGPPTWRFAHLRDWRYRELREEYRRLDVARDRFYARWDGSPWRRDRFEAWYASRLARLDGRRAELGRSWR